MQDADFSDEFCQFLQTTVPSVDVAEVLLYLRRHAAASHAPSEIVAGLKSSTSLTEAEAEKHIEALRAAQLVSVDTERRAQFDPATHESRRHADTLAAAYAERPVTLIRVIYALRDSKIRTFAEAFRIKR